MLRDPKVRFVYVMTKVAVFCTAALATWPLSRMIGPRAWVGLGVFGVILAVMTAAALLASPSDPDGGAESEDADDETDPGDGIEHDQLFEYPIEDSIDLHSFPPRDVPDVVGAYIESAVEKGFQEVRLIHGRGIGVQRDRVQKLLARHPLVNGFHDAPPERGGWGATVAYLKPEG